MEKLDRKEIKKNAKGYLKKNYLMSILLMFLLSVIMSNQYLFTTKLVSSEVKNKEEVQLIKYDEKTKKLIFNKEEIKQNKDKVNGVLAPIVGRLGISNSPVYNFVYSIQFFYNNSFSKGMYSLFIAFLSILIYLLIKLVLKVGRARFFMESRLYSKTSVTRLLFPYRVKGTFKLSVIMFFKEMYKLFWSFTIIGGFIKDYEYAMIPYVLAENPSLTKKEAFRLSKELMKGYKWQLFIVDLSLMGWYILDFFTMGLLGLLFIDAYKEYIYAEWYYKIRENKKNELTDTKRLNDTYLFNNKEELLVYPDDKLKIPVKKIQINTDYNQKYPIRNLILLFFTASFIGYSWEVFLHLMKDGVFVNRGVMFGPWLPIYGFGVVLILVLLKPFRDRPLLFFFMAMLMAGILEYSTAWGMETFLHKKWWDYSGYFMNIHGRVCLEGLLVFGLGGAAITYFLAPILNALFNKIKYRVVIIICVILLSLFGADAVYSSMHPNTGEGITDY